MPQAPMTDKDWQIRKKQAETRAEAITAETKALEAEEANIRARKVLEATQAPPDPARQAEAQRLAQARQDKDLAEASSAEQQARINTWKAAAGAIGPSTIEGKVELGEKAGQMESALLSTKAMTAAASKIAEAVATLKTAPAAILVMPHGMAPDLTALNSLRGFNVLMSRALISANGSLAAALDAREKPGLEGVVAPAVAGIGIAVEAASKLLGYFRTDYTIGGTEANTDQPALAEAVAGRLHAALPNTRIYLQSVYAGNEARMVADFVDNELKPLAELHQQALDKIGRAATRLAVAETPADAAAPQPEPASSGQAAPTPDAARDARVYAAADRLGKLVALYEAAIDKLMADSAMDTLVRQYAIDARLNSEKAQVLVTRLHKAGGSHYVTKNLWNLFGAMPFKVMGGVVASYSLFDGISGQLLQSDTHAVHGGFQTANQLS